MSSFSTYLIGFVIVIVGLAIGAYLLNVPTTWIAVGVIVLLGIGILSATSRTRLRDPSHPPAGSTEVTYHREPDVTVRREPPVR